MSNREVVLEIVCPYLAPKELFHVSQVSRRVRSSLSRSLVLQSIMYLGTTSSVQLISKVMDLIKAGKIYPPSPVRLLRLAIAKNCEIKGSFCDGRVAYNGPHLDYGLFSCKSCVHGSTTLFKHKTKRDLAIAGPALNSTRTCMWKGSLEAYMWTNPSISRDNESIGPLVTVNLMNRLRLENPNQPLQTSFDNYLKESTVMKETDPEFPEIKRFIDLFDRIESDASKFRQMTEKRKFQDKEQRALAKRVKANSVRERVNELVGELEISTEIWASSIIYKAIMEPFCKAPSKATKKALFKAAETIREYFGHVKADFLQFNFLDRIPGQFSRCLKVVMTDIGSSFITNISPYQLALIKLNLNAEALIFAEIPFEIFQEYAEGIPNCDSAIADLIWRSYCEPIVKALNANILETRTSWNCHVPMSTAMEQIKRNLPILRDSLFEKSLEPILEKTKKDLKEAQDFMEELLKFEWYSDIESDRSRHLEWTELYQNLFWDGGYGAREYLETKSFSRVFRALDLRASWIFR